MENTASKEVEGLPTSWVLCQIRDVGRVVSGGTPSTKVPAYWGDEIAWISPSDLTGYKAKFIARGAKSLTKEGLAKSSAVLMPAGSVHFSSRAPVGYVVISSQQLSTNQGFKSLVPASGVFSEYAYFYFKSIKGLAESKATGTTFRELSGSAFSVLPFPLPPLNEQKRIVAKIEELFAELDAGVENLKKARAQLGIYRQALLKKAFEGKLTEKWRAEHASELPTAEQLLARIQEKREARYQQQLSEWQEAVKAWEKSGKEGRRPTKPKKSEPLEPLDEADHSELPSLPDCWFWVRLEGIFLFSPSNGRSVKDRPGGYPVLRLTALREGRIDLLRFKEGAWTPKEATPFRVRKNDFLISRGNGSIRLVGRGGVVPEDRDVAFPDTMIRLPLDEQIVDVTNFSLLWNSEVFRQQIEKSARTTAGIYKINQASVRGYMFPLCSIAEQQEIVRILEEQFTAIEQNENEIDAALQRAEMLRQSILKKAFSGKLVPQDPSDEPANVLLERIRKEKVAGGNKRAERPGREATR